MAGGKGGTQTTQVKLPAHIERAAYENLGLADQAAQIGYTPYTGPTVAAFAPQQLAARQGVDQLAAAFGLPTVGGPGSGLSAYTGMPEPTLYAGGLSGYDPVALYRASIAALPPAQAQAITDFVMNPYDGSLDVPSPAFARAANYASARQKKPGRTYTPGGSEYYDPNYHSHNQYNWGGP